MVANNNNKEVVMNYNETKPFKNPYLIETKVEENFFLITNPCIWDGFKIININQYAILGKIDGQRTVADIANLTNYTDAEIKQVCDILSETEIVTRILLENQKKATTSNLWDYGCIPQIIAV